MSFNPQHQAENLAAAALTLDARADESRVDALAFNPIHAPADLAPGQAKGAVPAALVPKFFMQSEKSGDESLNAFGSLSSLSLKSRIRPGSGSFAAGCGPGGQPSGAVGLRRRLTARTGFATAGDVIGAPSASCAKGVAAR